MEEAGVSQRIELEEQLRNNVMMNCIRWQHDYQGDKEEGFLVRVGVCRSLKRARGSV